MMPRTTKSEKLLSCVESGVALDASYQGGIDDGHAVQKIVQNLGKIPNSEYARLNELVGRPVIGAVCRRDDPREVGFISCSVVIQRTDGECGFLFATEPDDVLSKENQRWIGEPIKR